MLQVRGKAMVPASGALHRKPHYYRFVSGALSWLKQQRQSYQESKVAGLPEQCVFKIYVALRGAKQSASSIMGEKRRLVAAPGHPFPPEEIYCLVGRWDRVTQGTSTV